jgi:hypothetical protein
VHDESARSSDLIENVGARSPLTRQITLLAAIGRTLRNAPSSHTESARTSDCNSICRPIRPAGRRRTHL